MSARVTAEPPEPEPEPVTAYRGRRIAVGTRHGKQRQLRPAFAAILGAELVTPPDLDTDQFGTFSGERPRRGSAIEAVRAKARIAIDATGLPCAVATEASYGWFGHEEIAFFCDTERGIDVVEGNRTAVVPGVPHTVAGLGDIPSAVLAGMPRQALIVRPASPVPCSGDPGIVKGIIEIGALRSAVLAAVTMDTDGCAVIEPDLRAHHNPARRRVLRLLGRRLALRIATACPACGAPGFGRVDSAPGLPCGLCRSPTALAHSEIHACCLCDLTISRPLARQWADPADCPICNP